MKNDLSMRKKAIYSIILAIGIFLSLELIASTALIYLYRWDKSKGLQHYEISSLSIVNLVYEAARATLESAGLCQHCRSAFANEDAFHIDVSPSPFFQADPELGYAPRPGRYTVTFSKKKAWQHDDKWVKFRTIVTINQDGTRWTGHSADPGKPSLYIFGDSFVFGDGVNDEQTFSFLLQQAMPSVNVRLFAAGGYSLTQAVLNFERIKDKISDHDIIILGYADFYDIRHVAAPSWLRIIEWFTASRFGAAREPNNIAWLPKASVGQDGTTLSFSHIQRDCRFNGSYCDQLDPTKEEMTNVTAALVNYIAENTNARLYLLHFDGLSGNPVLHLLDKRITLISALPGDFDYYVRDDVVGFDPHPGPYWHYAIFRKIRAVLGSE